MRLLRQVGRLEAALAREAEPAPVALAWTAQEERVEASGLTIGEYIALDVCVVELLGGVPVWHTRERVTSDMCDLGFVYRGLGLDDPGRVRVGRVVAVDGELVEWREEDAEGAGGPAASEV